MIINIRGTSGTGKSTLARQLMEFYGPRQLFRRAGRKQPLGYLYNRAPGQPPGPKLAVIGHYETPCGGADTINSYDELFDLARRAHDLGHDVLFEGLLITGDVKYTTQLARDGYPLNVVFLNVPVERCLENVNVRRRARNPDLPDVRPENTISKFKGAKLARERLAAAGVQTAELSYEEALAFCREVLRA